MKHAPWSLWLLASTLLACSPSEQEFYGVEMGGNLVGYVAVTTKYQDDEVTRSEVTKETFLKLTLLGRPVDLTTHEHWTFDPMTEGRRDYQMTLRAGSDLKVDNAWSFEANQAHFQPRTGGRDTTMVLSADVIVDDGRGFWFLAEELPPQGPEQKVFRQLDLARGTIHDVEYSRRESDRLVFDQQAFDCSVYDAFDRDMGTVFRVWIDGEGGLVKLEAPDGTVVSRASKGIRSRVRRASIDDLFFATVDEHIEDPQSLRFLKVEATIRSAGRPITVESLNVPGQRFTGSVDRNLIEGVFELETFAYHGENAPPFPSDFPPEELQAWLEPEILIESDDPVLIQTSRDITTGAENAWDAVVRIAQWIGENIGEDIPGGSARQTLDSRKGECGSHARLTAALCRASGIPCRVVSGCMYTLLRGGSFGQHAWNEVYMGPEGWIPLDTTVDEVGSINLGHVRLGEQVSFNPVRMKIVGFELDPADASRSDPGT